MSYADHCAREYWSACDDEERWLNDYADDDLADDDVSNGVAASPVDNQPTGGIQEIRP